MISFEKVTCGLREQTHAARDLVKVGDFHGAVTATTQMLDLYPGNALLWLQWARLSQLTLDIDVIKQHKPLYDVRNALLIACELGGGEEAYKELALYLMNVEGMTEAEAQAFMTKQLDC